MAALFEIERQRWRDRLHWDYSATLADIERARVSGQLPGFVAFDGGVVRGWSYHLLHRRTLQIGASRFDCSMDTDAQREVKVYLRPEDVLARPIAPGDPNVFHGDIDKIEFLGSYCLVRVRSEQIGPQPVTVYLSLNYLAEAGLEVGSRLPLRLMAERMRFF